MTNTNYIIRRAKESDYSFLAEAILNADLGIYGKNSSYAALFGISYSQAREAITAMMDEEVDGCEFSPVHFLIAESDNQPVACVSSWIENIDGVSSWMARTALIQHYYPKGALEHVQNLKHITDKVMVHRTDGTMQIESVYVKSEHRGHGLVSKLIKAHVAQFLLRQYPVTTAQLMTYTNNPVAIHAYEKIGFKIVKETNCTDADVLNYFPGAGMVLMETEIMNLIK